MTADETSFDGLPAADPEFARNPQPMYRMLREGVPVFQADGVGVIVTSRSATDEVLRHADIFSSNVEATDLKTKRPMIPLQIDPPAHRNFRKLLDPLFAPARMKDLEEPAQRLGQCLDRRVRRRRRDRLRAAVLDAVPFAGVPDADGAAARRPAPLLEDEGRHHPTATRRRTTARSCRRPTRTSRRRPIPSTSTSSAYSRACGRPRRRPHQSFSRRRGRRRSPESQRHPRHLLQLHHCGTRHRVRRRSTASSGISREHPDQHGRRSPTTPMSSLGLWRSCFGGRRPSWPSPASRPRTPR